MNTQQLEPAYLAAGFTPSKAKRLANRPVKRQLPFQKQPATPRSAWSDSTWNLHLVAVGELVRDEGKRRIGGVEEREMFHKAAEVYQSTNRAWRRARLKVLLRQLRKGNK